MVATAEVRVTLSEELLRHLRCRAAELRVPIKWLVAGLVCDTVGDHDATRTACGETTT
jgi:hypothetical protein